jgi:hypothetical protein
MYVSVAPKKAKKNQVSDKQIELVSDYVVGRDSLVGEL